MFRMDEMFVVFVMEEATGWKKHKVKVIDTLEFTHSDILY